MNLRQPAKRVHPKRVEKPAHKQLGSTTLGQTFLFASKFQVVFYSKFVFKRHEPHPLKAKHAT